MSKVGPGRRPKSTGFRKGVSGNPAGRPRKERPADPTSAFDVVIDKTLMIEQDGKSREVTIEEALWHKTYQNAIAGDRSAQREVLKMIDKLQWPESVGSNSPGVLVWRGSLTPHNRTASVEWHAARRRTRTPNPRRAPIVGRPTATRPQIGEEPVSHRRRSNRPPQGDETIYRRNSSLSSEIVPGPSAITASRMTAQNMWALNHASG